MKYPFVRILKHYGCLTRSNHKIVFVFLLYMDYWPGQNGVKLTKFPLFRCYDVIMTSFLLKIVRNFNTLIDTDVVVLLILFFFNRSRNSKFLETFRFFFLNYSFFMLWRPSWISLKCRGYNFCTYHKIETLCMLNKNQQ